MPTLEPVYDGLRLPRYLGDAGGRAGRPRPKEAEAGADMFPVTMKAPVADDAGMSRPRIRVAAYVIRHRAVPEVLVFDHVGIPGRSEWWASRSWLCPGSSPTGVAVHVAVAWPAWPPRPTGWPRHRRPAAPDLAQADSCEATAG